MGSRKGTEWGHVKGIENPVDAMTKYNGCAELERSCKRMGMCFRKGEHRKRSK